MASLERTTVQIPFGVGLVTNTDKRASSPPSLDVAHDVQFDEISGLQTRYPHAALNNSIFGGGTLANCRKFYDCGGELVCFTSTGLYTWNAQLLKWVLKGTHLAVHTTETPMFVTTGDQREVDRAELNSTVLYAWTDGTGSYVAAADKTTGAVLLAPTATSGSRQRVIALVSKFLLFVVVGSTLNVYLIDPASPATGLGSTTATISATAFNSYYDVVKVDGQDKAVGAHRRAVTTSYTAFTVDNTGAATTSTKARVCDGPIAVATIPGGTQTQIVRGHGTAIEGDLLTTSTLADVFTAQAIGTVASTPVNQIAAAFRSVQNGGFYRCYCFWDFAEATDATDWQTKSNWVDTNSALGTQAIFVRLLAPVSRAFDYGGSIFVWLAFAGGSGTLFGQRTSLQNTNFLYRDDGFLTAKALTYRAAGFSASTGHMPGVQLTSGSTGFTIGATERRRVELGSTALIGGTSKGFAERAPVDVVFTFDSNEARRTARLGQTLYIAGGECLQYDGTQLTEVGFHIYPWAVALLQVATGALTNGTYTYKGTLRWENARGESDRSTTATTDEVAIAGAPKGASFATIALYVTHKTSSAPSIEVWRTLLNPTAEAPFYLVTSLDPSVVANPNRYIANDPTTLPTPTVNDETSDATMNGHQENPENASVVPSLAPPPCSIIYATDTRLFLAGIAGDPDRIWYSKQRGDAEVAAFAEELTVPVPPRGGDITAVAFLNETLIVFRQYAVYALRGFGFDNTGNGQNFGPAEQLSADVGAVSMESVALTPSGLVFKSSKGWYLLTRQFQTQYIGGPVKAFDADTVYSVHVLESQHQIRCLTNNRMLVWDYFVNQWAEWTVSDGLHAAIWNGTYHYLSPTGPKAEQATYTNLTYGLDVETSWLKGNDLQGFARILEIMALGEYRGDHLLRARIAYDYESDGAGGWLYTDDRPWIVSPTTVGGPEQVRISPTRQQCQAIKVRLTAVAELARAFCAIGLTTDAVLTSGANWAAIFSAAAAYPGLAGNSLTFSCAFDAIVSPATFTIDVRDNLLYNQTSARWQEAVGNVGIRVQLRSGSSPTVAQLEAAISSGSKLCTLLTPDPAPTKVVNAAAMIASSAEGTFSFGTYTTPTTDALKLTGLAFLVGVQPGLNRRLPAEQKV